MHHTFINKYNYIINSYLFFILFISTTIIQGQSNDIIAKYLFTEHEIVGFKLISQFRNDWIVGDNFQLQKSLRQTWESDNKNIDTKITIEVCVFNSVVDALNGTAYNSRSYSSQFLWGSLANGIVGDNLWISANQFGNAIVFVRGNIGVHIGAPTSKHQEQTTLEEFAVKMLAKIEANLSPEVLNEEKIAKQNQISFNQYNNVINKFYELKFMEKFSLLNTKDSKWIIDDNTIKTGLMNEWKNDQGIIVGIDICQFKSSKLAEQAANIRSKNSFSPILDLNNQSSIDEILNSWEEGIMTMSSKKHNLSVIAYQGSSVLLIYQYSPDKVDKNLFTLITEQINFK